MTELLQAPPLLLAAVAGCALALLIGSYAVLAPGPVRLPLERRRPDAGPVPSLLTRTTRGATGLIDRLLHRRGRAGGAAVLERAGVKMPLQEVILLIAGGSLAAVAVGELLGGLILGLVLGVAVPILVRVYLGFRASRRQKAFADQLEDSLQLMASNLRAGHSLLQALASVAREAEEPTSEEFARVINETRIGRELGAALDETGRRMGSEDFLWVTQAVAINREVGGNLAEVLDGVGHTIRERNQIRRQVKALSAEGKLSALVLMALPFGILAFLSVTNPKYIAKFTESLVGYAMIATGVVLLIVGGFWLWKTVSFKF